MASESDRTCYFTCPLKNSPQQCLYKSKLNEKVHKHVIRFHNYKKCGQCGFRGCREKLKIHKEVNPTHRTIIRTITTADGEQFDFLNEIKINQKTNITNESEKDNGEKSTSKEKTNLMIECEFCGDEVENEAVLKNHILSYHANQRETIYAVNFS